jgi:Mn2+/Fe2+ NRAMP family transporter
LPVPVIALVLLGAHRKIMGDMVNRPFVTALAVCAAVTILGLNVVLIWTTVHPS